MSLTTAAAAFDRASRAYDATFGADPVACLLRARVWERIAARVRPPALLLDVGCGTGIDALHLAELGHTVIATDVSPLMIEALTEKLGTRTGVRPHALDAGDAASWSELEQDERVTGMVDLAYSNFGALNCVADLGTVRPYLARMLRPGGWLVLVLMARLCPWELAHLRARRLRRRPVGMVDGVPIALRYPTQGQIARELAPDFTLARSTPLGLCLPAPASGRTLPPALASFLHGIDGILHAVPGLRAMGDHVIVELERR